MKKITLLLSAALLSLSASADFTGAGYYRLENVNSHRYVCVIDNDCAYVNLVTGDIDSHALVTQKDFEIVCHDPATIIYAVQESGTKYEVAAQGVSMKNMVKYDLHLGTRGKEGDQTMYWLYATQSGATKYLSDPALASKQTGYVALGNPIAGNATSQKKLSWFIVPVAANSANYFGVLPKIEASKGQWTTLYASFPYSVYSPNVEFYYPCAVASTGIVEMKKIEGTVPAGMPVVVKCLSIDPADNRLNVGAAGGTKAKDNLLKGVYFNCYENNGQYVNRVANDKNTMRVLGKCQDGSIGFVLDETLDYIPANTAYIVVEPWYPKELRCVFSHAEFEAGVKEVFIDADQTTPEDVYTVGGILVMSGATQAQISKLPEGFYIIGGKKKYIK